METTLAIRPATPGDWASVHRLLTELEHAAPDQESCRSVYLANLPDPAVRYFVACNGEDIMGFASLHVQRLLHHAAPIGELQELIVTARCRGQGIGSALFRKIIETAEALGCPQLEVCCNKARRKSHEFYRRQGMSANHDKFCLAL